jgi:hypothetical protein
MAARWATAKETAMSDDDRRITCNEAGHAIVAVYKKIPFTRVWRGREEDGGVCLGVNPVDNWKLAWMEPRIREYQEFYAAGAAAERIMFKKDREGVVAIDKGNHGKLDRRLNRTRKDGFEEDIQAAMRLLDRRLIERVVKQLDAKAEMTFEEVAEIIGSDNLKA